MDHRTLLGTTAWAALSIFALSPVSAEAATAQDAAASGPAGAGQPSTVASGNSTTPAGQIGDIVVTATRRSTSLQKTPIAISAFDQKQLDTYQIKDVTQLAQFVPSLHFNQNTFRGAVTLTLRGIGNDSALGVLQDPEVAFYVDGVYSARPQGATVLAYDLERLDVLRGPQGTLFGRNATVGAVQFDTAKPSFDGVKGYAELLGGSYNRFGSQGMINLPVSPTLAFRAAFITDQDDGYVHYQTPPIIPGVNTSTFITSGARYYRRDQRSVRLSAAWEPSDRFRWDLNGEYFRDTGTPIIALMEHPRPGERFWSTLSDTAPYQDRYSYAIRSNMSYDITDGIQLAYIAGWNRVGGPTREDADAGALPPSATDPDNLPNGAFEEDGNVYERDEFWSQEVQLKSTGKHRIDWIIGGYYSHEDNKIRYDYDIRNGYRDGTFNGASAQIAEGLVNSRAGFGQAIWHVTPTINLTGGIRYTDDGKSTAGGNVNGFNPTCAASDTGADGTCSGLFGIAPNATPAELASLVGFKYKPIVNSGNWSKITWLGRVDANITSSTLVYGSVSTGFHSGVLVGATGLANPETLTNYEVGVKQRFLDGRATLNLAAYYLDFKGFQIAQVIPTYNALGVITSSLNTTTNAKGATGKGIEAELSANITHLDHIQIAADVQKTRLQKVLSSDARLYDPGDPSTIEDLAGNELPHAPRFSINGTYIHDFELANGALVSPRATVHYETSSWLSYFDGDPVSRFIDPAGKGTYGTDWDKQKAYTKLDVAISYQAPNSKYVIELFGQNVTNTRIRTASFVYGPIVNPPVFLANYAPAATWGGRVRLNF